MYQASSPNGSLILLAALLWACGNSADAQPGTPSKAVRSVATAPPMQQIAFSEVQSQYFTIKRLLQTRLNQRAYPFDTLEFPRALSASERSKLARSGSAAVIGSCATGAWLIYGAHESVDGRTPTVGWADVLVDLAHEVLLFRTNVRNIGFPEAVWRASLVEAEAVGIQIAFDISSGKLAPNPKEMMVSSLRGHAGRYDDKIGQAYEDLERYRLLNDGRFPEVVSADGCGAGERFIDIKTVPAGGTVSLIPSFLATVCEQMGKQVDAGRDCGHWFDVASQTVAVSGKYRYKVTWSDGRTRHGAYDFDKAPEKLEVVFRKD